MTQYLPCLPSETTQTVIVTTGGAQMNYLQTVQAANEAEKVLRQFKSQHLNEQWKSRLSPIEDRLRPLLLEIPEAVASKGIALDALRQMLKGRWRGQCHPGELGAGLRKLGWVRKRSWSDEGEGFRAKWFKASK
jgi:hypothetical protein